MSTTAAIGQEQRAHRVVVFESPAGFSEEDIARTTTKTIPEPLKKTGLLPVQVDSMHRIKIKNEKRQNFVTCKDRANYSDPGGFFFCLHKGCEGRGWDSMKELREDEAHNKMAREFAEEAEVHPIGFWCTDDAGGPEEGCADCKKATAAAVKEKGEGATKACQKHARGVVGLLTPGDVGG